jgi:GNAT superfamily N-acetyltransferase
MTAIRPMEASDAAVVADLTSQLGYPSSAGEIASRFGELRARPDDEVLVATDSGGIPIGWVHVGRVAGLEFSATALIGGLVMDDEHRSRGVGEQLLAAAEDWARRRGATTMIVRSRNTRQRAHRFYERAGYAQVKLSHVFEKPLVKE